MTCVLVLVASGANLGIGYFLGCFYLRSAATEQK